RLAAHATLAAALLAAPLSCASPDDDAEDDDAAPAATARVAWTDGLAVAAGGGLLRARIDVDRGTDTVAVQLRNAYPVAIPKPCVQSNVKVLHSYLDGRTLVCELDGDTTSLSFDAIVDGDAASRVEGAVAARRGGDTARADLPVRLVVGRSDVAPDLRLLSSPDFLNADVADLRRGPNRWNPSRSANSTNASYEKVLDGILDDWAELDPAAVLVAGDLVNGRWGYDDKRTGSFGPVGTLAQKKAALRSAARTYYPQWQQRFDDHGLQVFPSIGDHEMGDNPFGPTKRGLASTFREEFARQFTTNPDGSARYPDRPRGPASRTAFAGRPTPDLQIVSLDVFHVTPQAMRIRIDRQQMRWLKQVLARAQRDRVKWVIVESHVPIAFPVRNRASSALHYEGATDSQLWKVLQRYDVDLYLSGEVHDTQLVARDGIVQVSHGGAFQYGLTTALVLDFYGDDLYLTLRDYDVTKRERGRRLWETRRSGLPPQVVSSRGALTIGTATVRDGELTTASGILTPLR
ncbi:MAG: hypothetical protein JWN84_4369, partial [Nocardioides sp.]|nr:hypothetical protein [Nocardioides sp.]